MKKSIKIIIGVASLFIILSIISTIFYIKSSPKIKLLGDKEITLNLGDEYIEKGAEANFLGKELTDKIKTSGTVNNNKVGTYKISYSISTKLSKNKSKVTRIINIIDSTLPIIKLNGNSTITLYVDDKYMEPGFTASDNYDGDITKKVIVTNNINTKKAGTYEVIYSVTDSSNNKSEEKRKIIIKEKPITSTKTTTTKKSGHGLPVLMYHYFYDSSKGETGKNSNWMEISSFENQVKYLVENNYYFPSWEEVSNFVAGKISLPKKSVVITIDDGHSSLFEKAIPIIEKYKVKATAFIITSKDAGTKFKKYKSNYINFESHTHDMHKGGCSGGHGGLFRCIAYQKGLDDLKKSIQILGSNNALAYPYGDVTDNVLKITKASGIKLAFTTKYGKVYKGMDKLQLPRVRMSKGISIKGFANSL